MRNKHVFQHPLLSPLHMEKELISIKGVHLIFWQVLWAGKAPAGESFFLRAILICSFARCGLCAIREFRAELPAFRTSSFIINSFKMSTLRRIMCHFQV